MSMAPHRLGGESPAITDLGNRESTGGDAHGTPHDEAGLALERRPRRSWRRVLSSSRRCCVAKHAPIGRRPQLATGAVATPERSRRCGRMENCRSALSGEVPPTMPPRRSCRRASSPTPWPRQRWSGSRAGSGRSWPTAASPSMPYVRARCGPTSPRRARPRPRLDGLDDTRGGRPRRRLPRRADRDRLHRPHRRRHPVRCQLASARPAAGRCGLTRIPSGRRGCR